MDDVSPDVVCSNELNYLFDSISDSSPDTRNLKANLIVYDDPQVFKRLWVHQVDNNLVSACARFFENANKKYITLLLEAAEKVSMKDDWQLDGEQKSMYDPLVGLFDYISTFGDATAPRRKFQKTNGTLKPNEPHTFAPPSCSPDLTINATGNNTASSNPWLNRDAFVQVKPSRKQGPKPTIAGTIPNIVTQSADYVSLFMSVRPFMLFCVGILIFGTEFCVGIFDRDGVTFSPIYNMFKDMEIFIRVVRSLTCNLSIERLGFDPTVRVLDPSETRRLLGRRSKDFPSAVVSSVGNDRRLWCTIGPPIWASISLLDRRGTNIWLVRRYVEGTQWKSSFLLGNDMIMKTTWRSSARTSESDIYMSITQPPEGLAEFECGGDVKFVGRLITVQNLRSDMLNDSLPEGDDLPTPVLHRLVLRTIGRPMWEYTSDLELLLGFRDALLAHENLSNQGILHRDISNNNILLVTNQDGPLRGFITDLGSAQIQNLHLTKPQVTSRTAVGPHNKYNDQGRVLSKTEPTTRTHITFESKVKVKHDATLTGTIPFMAKELLEQPAGSVVHEVKHDVESFIWVLSYCVMHNVFERATKSSVPEVQSQCSEFGELFRDAFGVTKKRDIAWERQSRSAIVDFPRREKVDKIVTNLMSNALIVLFTNLQYMVYLSDDPFTPTPITHRALLAAVDAAIASLS